MKLELQQSDIESILLSLLTYYMESLESNQIVFDISDDRRALVSLDENDVFQFEVYSADDPAVDTDNDEAAGYTENKA